MSAIDQLSDKIDESNRKYVIIGIIVFIFVVYYFLVLNPQLSILRKISPEIMVLKQDLEKAQTDMGKMGLYQKQIDEFEGKLKTMGSRVQSRENVSLILERISELANKYDVRIDQIMPLTDKQEKLLENTEGVYYSLPILIEGKSDYHNFGRFINGVENHEISLSIERFIIQDSSADAKKHTIRVTLNAVVVEKKAK